MAVANLADDTRSRGLPPALNELKVILGRLEAVQAHPIMLPYLPILRRVQNALRMILMRELQQMSIRPNVDLPLSQRPLLQTEAPLPPRDVL